MLNDLLDKPYSDFGMGPDTYNCWGLVREVLSRMGIANLPRHDDVHPDDAEELTVRYDGEITAFYEVDKPAAGDVMAVYRGNKTTHVGVCVDVDGQTMVMHTSREQGPRINRLSSVKRVYNCKWLRHA